MHNILENKNDTMTVSNTSPQSNVFFQILNTLNPSFFKEKFCSLLCIYSTFHDKLYLNVSI